MYSLVSNIQYNLIIKRGSGATHPCPY